MDTKRIVNVLLNLMNIWHIFVTSSMVNGFMQAYYLARSMDLSWGNRPSMDLSISSSRTQFAETRKTCKMEKCTAVSLESSGLLCVDHEWLRHNILVWKFINLVIICCNIGILMIMILCNLDQILPLAIAFILSLNLVSNALIIVGDFFVFGRYRLDWAFSFLFKSPKKNYHSIA